MAKHHPLQPLVPCAYQSDLDANEDGIADISVPLRSIFLDQIFGFDGDKNPDGSVILPPVNTYHVGFWFNNPENLVVST